jgi:transposase
MLDLSPLSREEVITHYESLLSHSQECISNQAERIASLEAQLKWFRTQLFGAKSERRLYESLPPKEQLALGELLHPSEDPPPTETTVKSYERTQRGKKEIYVSDESKLRFDASVPVQTIDVPNPALEGLSEDEYHEIEERVTYRLAQRPGAYVVLKYVQKTVKKKEDGTLSRPPLPPAVIERSFADVSFLAGLIIEKFVYHLPLYRQHQRLKAAGVTVERATLTNLVHRSAQLLEPLYCTLLSSVLQSDVLTMDETPIKAGRGHGKMKQAFFWPLYGDKDEIVFLFSPTRAQQVVKNVLSGFQGTLLTDGYAVYEKYAAEASGITHAQCWSHTRRQFIKAEQCEPELVRTVLTLIRTLYETEEKVREGSLEERARVRAEKSTQIVEEIVSFAQEQLQYKALLPSHPLVKACYYLLNRKDALSVFLNDPTVPIDTNHIERMIRPVALGRKNFLFCWTELGARYAAILYSLISSCKLHNIDPYNYLVDVLQRIDSHQARNVGELIPRVWKETFLQQALSSDVQ